MTVDVALNDLAEAVFVRFLHFIKLFLPTSSSERCHYTHPYLRYREVSFTSLRAEYLYKAFEIFLCGRFVSFPHVYPVIYLYQYEHMNMYFLISVILQYYCISLLRLFQLWSLVDGCVPLACPVTMGFFSFFRPFFPPFLPSFLMPHIPLTYFLPHW